MAVIAGAAQRVGYLVAKKLSETHRAVIVDLAEHGVDRAAATCGPDALGVECNIIEQSDLDAAHRHDHCRDRRDRRRCVDCGLGIGGALRHTHPDVVAAQLNINVTGNRRFVHGCPAPGHREQGVR